MSAKAALLLTSIIPADFVSNERSRVRRLSMEVTEISLDSIRKEEREMDKWERFEKVRWTHSFLPDVTTWLMRPTPLTFHLTQALSNHGYFRSYTHRMKRVDGSLCVYCSEEHTIFDCPHWAEKRERMRPFLNDRLLLPEDVADIICGPAGGKDRVNNFYEAMNRERTGWWEHGGIYTRCKGKWRTCQHLILI